MHKKSVKILMLFLALTLCVTAAAIAQGPAKGGAEVALRQQPELKRSGKREFLPRQRR